MHHVGLTVTDGGGQRCPSVRSAYSLCMPRCDTSGMLPRRWPRAVWPGPSVGSVVEARPAGTFRSRQESMTRWALS